MTAISVVVPTHNRRGWLGLTLATVLRQRDVSVEVIVVDDGSTDGTAGMVRGLGDARIRVVRHEHPRGVSASRNHGALKATGEWLAFLDDDDLWAPDKLRRQIDAAGRADLGWAYTGSVNVGEGLGIISGAPPHPPDAVSELIFRYNAIPGGGSNVIVRRDLFERVGPFDLRLKNTEDWEMWIRLAEREPPAWAPDPLLAYRVHPANASLDVAQILAGVRLIEQSHRTNADRGTLHRWIAESCMRTGQRGAALRHLAMAARYGQAVGVSDDLVGILHRRFAGPRSSPTKMKHPDWIARAERWLADVREIQSL